VEDALVVIARVQEDLGDTDPFTAGFGQVVTPGHHIEVGCFHRVDTGCGGEHPVGGDDRTAAAGAVPGAGGVAVDDCHHVWVGVWCGFGAADDACRGKICAAIRGGGRRGRCGERHACDGDQDDSLAYAHGFLLGLEDGPSIRMRRSGF